jgi:hypothetical protein
MHPNRSPWEASVRASSKPLEQIEERIGTQFATREFRFLSKAVTLCNTFKGALSSTWVEEYVYNV